jgi:hypothetical protein
MAATLERNTKALKTVVIVLGVLIVIGAGIVIVTIANRLTGGPSRPAEPAVAGAAPGAFGTVQVPLPARCRVQSATPSGDRLVLQLVGNADECRQILVVHLGTGELLGRLDLVPPAGEPQASETEATEQ